MEYNFDEEIAFLTDITLAKGVSGREKEVAKTFIKYAEPYADEIKRDALGNVIAYHYGKPNGPVVMMCGHMDEVGFFVKSIEDNGLIRLHPIGGWWPLCLPSDLFVVTNKEGKEFLGVIGARAPHGVPQEQRKNVIPLENLYLDLGVKDKKMVDDLKIKVGDMVTPKVDFHVMNDGKTLMSKAFDDRIGAAIALRVLKNLKGVETECTYVCVGTTQEEVGLRGSKTSAYGVEPDIAFATDVSLSHDTPDVLDGGDSKLGAGVAMTLCDAGILSHPGLVHYLKETAQRLDIPYTNDFMAAGSTDAGTIHKTREGVMTMTVSLACRYYHSPYSMINYDDYINACKLMTEAIKNVDRKVVNKIREAKY